MTYFQYSLKDLQERSSKKEFNYIVNQIQKDSFAELNDNFNNLKEYMKKFSNKEKWSKRIKTNLEITI